MINPAHPGRILRSFIEGLREESGMPFTLEEVARKLQVSTKTLSFILNEKQSISPEMALRLAAAFPNSTPENWMQLQDRFDLAQARKTSLSGQILPLWPMPPASAA
jgi:antitoxin HigA-1